MGFIGYRIFNPLTFNGEPILASLNARPHYYKFFGPICNGASPREYRNRGGFYAFKDVEHMKNAFCIMGRGFTFLHVWAEVEMFGEVIEHQFGYRSSKLMFNHIYIPRHTFTDKQIVMLERRYQCDVSLSDDSQHNPYKGVPF